MAAAAGSAAGVNNAAAAAGGGNVAAPLLIRVLMIGDSSVGKTSLVLRYDKRGYNPKFTTTIGVDYSDRLLDVDGRQVKLQIWDTAGQERFHSLTTSFFKRAEGFVLVYDVGKRQTFEAVQRWMKDIGEQGKAGSNVIICANKSDLPTWEVTKEDGKKLATQYNVPHFETSAKENINVDEVFSLIAKTIKDRLEGSSAKPAAAKDTVKLSADAPETSSSSCCS